MNTQAKSISGRAMVVVVAVVAVAIAGCMSADGKVTLSDPPNLNLGALHPAGMVSAIDDTAAGCGAACSMLETCYILDDLGLTVAQCVQYCGIGYFDDTEMQCIAAASDCVDVEYCTY